MALEDMRGFLDRQVTRDGPQKLVVGVIAVAGSVASVIAFVHPWSVAVLILESLVLVAVLLLCWIYAGRTATSRADTASKNSALEAATAQLGELRRALDQHDATAQAPEITPTATAVLEQIEYIASTGGGCCSTSGKLEPVDSAAVRNTAGYHGFEDQVVEAIAQLLGARDRRFAIYYGDTTSMHPELRQGWPEMPPPALAQSADTAANQIDARTLLADVQAHRSRNIPDVMNAIGEDLEPAACVVTTLAGQRYRTFAWYPVAVYEARQDAARRQGIIIGALMVQCSDIAAINTIADRALGVFAYLLGFGFAAAAKNGGEVRA